MAGVSMAPYRPRALAVVSRRFHDRVIIEKVIQEMFRDRLPGLLDSFAFRFVEAKKATLLAIDALEDFRMRMEHRRPFWSRRLLDTWFSIWIKE